MNFRRIGRLAYDGVVDNNPTFRMVLGLCPTLAVTVTALNGLGMGLATMFVLVMSNIAISLLRHIIPDTVRIPCYIIVIATIVTIIMMLTQRFMPDLYSSLGIFLPLIVVNCIVFARAESYASKNTVLYSAFDGLFNGAGFTLSLTLLASLRELLNSGKVFGVTVKMFGLELFGDIFPKFAIFGMPAGGFLLLAFLMALYNFIFITRKNKKKPATKFVSAKAATAAADNTSGQTSKGAA